MERLLSWFKALSLPETGEAGGILDKKRIAGFFILLAAFFYIDKVLFGPFAAVRLHDVLDSDMFRYQVLAAHFPASGFPQWYPNYAGGMPAYAWHHTPFYILTLLASFLPLWLIYSGLVVLVMAGAGWGMYRLLSEHAGLDRLSALLGGAFFAVVSQVQPNNLPLLVFNYTFPLFFVWFMDVYRYRGSPRLLLAPLAGINVILALSYPVLTLPFFSTLHLLFLLVYTGRESGLRGERKGLLAWFFILWLGYALVCAPVLYSLFSFIPFACKRAGFEGNFVLIAAAAGFLKTALATLVTSALRCAVLVPLIAALPLLARGGKLRIYYGAIGAAALVSAFFSTEIAMVLGNSLFLKMDLGHFFWTLPVLQCLAVSVGTVSILAQPEAAEKCFKYALAGLALLAGLGFTGQALPAVIAPNIFSAVLLLLILRKERFVKAGLTPKAMQGAVIFSLIVIFSFCKTGEQLILPALFYLAITAALTIKAGRMESAPRAYAFGAVIMPLLLILSVRLARNKGEEPEADRYMNLAGYSGLKVLKNDGDPYRTGSTGLHPAYAISQGLETADARGPVFSRHYKELFKLILLPQLKERVNEAFFDNYWYNLFFSRYIPAAGYNYNIARLANIRYFITPAPDESLQKEAAAVMVIKSDMDVSLGRFRPFLKKTALGRKILKRYFVSLYVYDLKNPVARAFLVPGAELFKDGKSLLKAMSGASLEELTNRAFIEEGEARPGALPFISQPGKVYKGKIETVLYKSDRAVYHVESDKPALLVFSANYHPDWNARVNGKGIKIIRANNAFMSVVVPAGVSEVLFEYKSPLLPLMLKAMAVGILLINILLLPLWRPRLPT